MFIIYYHDHLLCYYFYNIIIIWILMRFPGCISGILNDPLLRIVEDRQIKSWSVDYLTELLAIVERLTVYSVIIFIISLYHINYDEISRLYFGDSERSSLKDCWGSSNQILERWLLDGIVGDCGTISKAARWLMKTVLGCSLAQISFVGLIMIWIPFLGGGSLACWPRFDAHFWVDSTSGLARSSSSISAFARAFLFSKNLLPFLPVSFLLLS